MHKWDKDAEKEAFVMPCHGNASKPAAKTYYRTDPEVLRVIKSNIEEDKLSCEIYENINTATANSASMEVRNVVSRFITCKQQKYSFEIDSLIWQIQENNDIFMQSMTLLLKHYI